MVSGDVAEINEMTQGRQAEGGAAPSEEATSEYGGWAFSDIVFSLVELGGQVRSFTYQARRLRISRRALLQT